MTSGGGSAGPPIRTVVVDDEPEARDGLARLLEGRDGYEVVAVCSGGREAVEVLREGEVELLLLDVQMPEVDGFDVLAALDPAERPVVIFVTAYDRYAVEAFDVHALDYLVKPYSEQRLDEALGRARERVTLLRVGDLGRRLARLLDESVSESRLESPGPASGGEAGDPAPSVSRIVVRNHRGVHFVPVEEIDRIEAADYYARIHAGDRRYLLRQSLTDLAARLPEALFLRTHRSAIVNLRRVRRIESSERGLEAVLDDGSTVPVARSRKDELVAAVERWSAG